MTEKRYSFNWERGHPNFWDNYCDLADCYLTCEDVVKLLNELHEENQQCENEIARLQLINNKLKDKDYTNYKKKIQELQEENKELKAKVDDKEIAVEVETEKLMQKVFNAIDEKIDELEKKYKFGQEVAKCCPMHNILHSINTLKELKKELQE